ncbi:hypothetical protein [Lunatibacter salilacus]|uniref:hypothetical protein n=1 Tax=Lunatibacter salilacus TaxID=2483804 RepID=UPI00131C379E|nr:hypothetical protein [Lunatibacter salilacus]
MSVDIIAALQAKKWVSWEKDKEKLLYKSLRFKLGDIVMQAQDQLKRRQNEGMVSYCDFL